MVHQITEVRLLIGLEVPSKYDLVASRKKNIRQEAVFILPLVPQAAWVSTEKIHYLYQEKWQNVKSIYQNLESPLDPRTPIIGSVCVKLREDKVSPVDEFVDARIVFIKDRRSENWLTNVSPLSRQRFSFSS